MLDMFISGELMNAEHLCLITTASQTPDGSIAQYFGLTLFFFLQPESEKPRCRPPLLMQNRGNLAVMYSDMQFSFLLVLYPHSSDEIHLKKVVNAKDHRVTCTQRWKSPA